MQDLPEEWMGGTQSGNRVVNQLLASMDGIESLDGVIVVAATNRPEMIDRKE